MANATIRGYTIAHPAATFPLAQYLAATTARVVVASATMSDNALAALGRETLRVHETTAAMKHNPRAETYRDHVSCVHVYPCQCRIRNHA